jgi:hypothetical protein
VRIGVTFDGVAAAVRLLLLTFCARESSRRDGGA